MHLSQRKEGYRHLGNFTDFLQIHNPFKVSSSDLINIATGTIASSDVNVDSPIVIEKRRVHKVVNNHFPKSHSRKRTKLEHSQL